MIGMAEAITYYLENFPEVPSPPTTADPEPGQAEGVEDGVAEVPPPPPPPPLPPPPSLSPELISIAIEAQVIDFSNKCVLCSLCTAFCMYNITSSVVQPNIRLYTVGVAKGPPPLCARRHACTHHSLSALNLAGPGRQGRFEYLGASGVSQRWTSAYSGKQAVPGFLGPMFT